MQNVVASRTPLGHALASPDYQRGALDFRAMLVELEHQLARWGADRPGEVLPFSAFAPALRARFDAASAHPDTDAGFWAAFATFLALFVEGTHVSPECWDVLGDLADEAKHAAPLGGEHDGGDHD